MEQKAQEHSFLLLYILSDYLFKHTHREEAVCKDSLILFYYLI